MDRLHHHAVVEADAGGQGHSPGCLELAADGAIVDGLVAGKEVGHGAEVAGALHVVVAAERIGAGTFAHVVAREQEEVGDGGGSVGAAAVLGDAHGPENAGAIGLGDFKCDGLDVFGCDAGDTLGVLEGEGLEGLFVGVEVIDPLLDEIQLGEVMVEEIFCYGVDPDGIGGGVGADEEVGALGHLVLAEVGDDEALAVQLVGTFYAGGEDRVGLGGIGADDEDQAGFFDVGDGAGVAAILDSTRKAHGGGGLAVARTVVDVVGADDGAGQLLHQVALFVGALGGGDEGESVGAVGGFDFGELGGDEGEGFVPGSLDEAIAVADERLGETIVRVDVLPGEFPLDAGGDAVGGAGAGFDLEDVAVAGPDIEAATDAAVGADGLGFLDAELAHVRFDLGEREDGAVPDLRLNIFDDLDHVLEGFGGEVGEVACAA